MCLGSGEEEKKELCQGLAQETSLRPLRWVPCAHLIDGKLEDAEQRGGRSEVVQLLCGRAWTHAGILFPRSVMSDSATPWTVAYQAPLSMGFFQAIVLEWIAIS